MTSQLKPTRLQAVINLVGGQVSWYDGEVSLNDGQTLPSEEVIQSELTKLQAEYDAQEYARNRKIEYDALNQFELISDDAVNGTTTHKDAIAAIKTKYPKG